MVLYGLMYKPFPKNVPLIVFNEKQIKKYSFLLILRISVHTTDHMSWLSSHKPPLCTKNTCTKISLNIYKINIYFCQKPPQISF